MFMPDEQGKGVTEQFRVMSAAVFLRRFTARQVMQFTGLGERTVCEMLERLDAHIQRTERPAIYHGGAVQVVYDLTTHARDRLRDSIKLRHSVTPVRATEMICNPPVPSSSTEEVQTASAIYQEIVISLQAARDVLDRILPAAASRDTGGYITLAFEQIAAAEFGIAAAKRSSQLDATDRQYLRALASVSTMLLRRAVSRQAAMDAVSASPSTDVVVPVSVAPESDSGGADEAWRRFVSVFDVQWVGTAPANWDATPASLFLVTTPRSLGLDEAIAAAAAQMPGSAAVAHLSGAGALASSEIMQGLANDEAFVPTLIAIVDSGDLVSCVSFDWLVTRFVRQPAGNRYWRELVVLDMSSSCEIPESIRRFPSCHYCHYLDLSRSSDIVAAVGDSRRSRKISRFARAK